MRPSDIKKAADRLTKGTAAILLLLLILLPRYNAQASNSDNNTLPPLPSYPVLSITPPLPSISDCDCDCDCKTPTPTKPLETPTPTQPQETPTPTQVTPTPTETVTPTQTPTPTTVTATPTHKPTPTDKPSDNGNGDGDGDGNGDGDDDNGDDDGDGDPSEPARGGVAVLTLAPAPYNPLLGGIRESYGEVLGVASDKLPKTHAADKEHQTSSYSGNELLPETFLTIRKLGLRTQLHEAQTLGSDLLVGADTEILANEEVAPNLIYSHNAPTTFALLHTLSEGDSVTYTRDSRVESFEVVRAMRVTDTSLEILQNNDPNVLYLMTCDPSDDSIRFVIEAHKTTSSI